MIIYYSTIAFKTGEKFRDDDLVNPLDSIMYRVKAFLIADGWYIGY